MPLFFGSIGLLLIIAGLRDRVMNGNPSLVSLLWSDFDVASPSSFTMWAFAIIFIGAIGYIPKMRSISRMFLVLVVAVIFVKNKQLQTVFDNIASFFGKNAQGSQVTALQNPNSPLGVSNANVVGNVLNPPLIGTQP